MVYKKYFKYYLLIVALIICDTAYSQYGTTYRNSKYGYSIILPKGMEISELPSKSSPDKVYIQNNDNSSLSIIVTKDEKLKGITADQLDIINFFTSLSNINRSTVLLENDYTTIGIDPALYGKYKLKVDDEEVFLEQYYLVKGSYLYILQVMADTDKFDEFEGNIKGYLLTFNFIEVKSENFFKSEKYEFGLLLPEGWNVKGTEVPIEITCPDGCNIYIEVYKDSQYNDMTANDINTDEFLDALRSNLKSVSMISRRNLRLDNVPAICVKYFWREKRATETVENIIVHYYIIRNSMLYILQGMARDQIFQKDEEVITKSLESIRFLK